MGEPLRVPEHMNASELVEECRRVLLEIRTELDPLLADVRRRFEAGELLTRRDLSIYNRTIQLARYAGDCAHRAVHMTSRPRTTERRKRGPLFWFTKVVGEGEQPDTSKGLVFSAVADEAEDDGSKGSPR